MATETKFSLLARDTAIPNADPQIIAQSSDIHDIMKTVLAVLNDAPRLKCSVYATENNTNTPYIEWYNTRLAKQKEEKKPKLDVRELISMAGFELVKGIIESKEKLEEMGLSSDEAEAFQENYSQLNCYYLMDTCKSKVRAVYLGDTFTKGLTRRVLDELDVFVFDLVFEDAVNNFVTDKEAQSELWETCSYEDLYQYLTTHPTQISDWELGWVEVLAYGTTDNVIEF